MQILIISEKPSLGKTIADALLSETRAEKLHISGKLPGGESCVVTWARGHLLSLASPKEHNSNWEKWMMEPLPFLPASFKDVPISDPPNKKYPNSASSTQVLSHIVGLLGKLSPSGEVVNACDAGREGDLIFTKILKHANVKPAKISRLWIQSTLKEAILDAYKMRKPASSYAGLTMSAYTRDRADWLWGMNLTRMATLRLGERKQVLPVGRVQTPTLGMIVRREKLRKGFVPANYYTILAQFPSGIGELDMSFIWKREDKTSILGSGPDYAEDIKGFWDKDKCDKYALFTKELGEYSVKDTVKTEKQNPPLPFDLPSLQTDCNKSYSWTAANTLKFLQTLYDSGYVTYPRTDCKYLPEDMVDAIYRTGQDVVSGLKEFHGVLPVLKPGKLPACFNSSRVTDHYAIIPTGKFQGIERMKENDRNLYTLYLHICRRLLQALDTPATFQVTSRRWTAKKDSTVNFSQSARMPENLGWKRWAVKEDKRDEALPPLKNAVETPLSLSSVSHVTKCPPAYSEGALISAMESVGRNMNPELLQDLSESEAEKILKNKGIGTAATRHEVIEKLVHSGYIVREKRNVLPTDLGIMLINKLDNIDPLISAPEQTAIWEQQLVEMEQGKGSFKAFILALYQELKRIKGVFMEKIPAPTYSSGGGSLKDSDTICPISGQPMKIGEKFYISPAYPKIPLWKNLAGKAMTLYDWVRILEAYSNRQRFVMRGFNGKFGEYAASVSIDSDKGKVLIFPVKEMR